MNKKTAIVIVNYKTPWHIEQCISLVFKHTQDFHIFLVQNAPDKDSIRIASSFKSKYPSDITVINNDKNLGYVGGINSAYEGAIQYERVCLLNSDILVTKGWLSELNKVLDVNPDVVQVAPDCNHFYKDKFIWEFAKKRIIPLWPALGFRLYKLRYYLNPPRSTSGQVGFAPASHFYQFPGGFCNLFVSKYFKELGYFLDPNIAHGYWDDNDMAFYLRQFGKVGATTDSYVFHFVNTSFRKIGKGKKELKADLIKYNSYYVVDKWSEYIASELAKYSAAELMRHSSQSDEVQTFLRYFGARETNKEFLNLIRSMPAKEIAAKLLG